jgi:hypothetical protein
VASIVSIVLIVEVSQVQVAAHSLQSDIGAQVSRGRLWLFGLWLLPGSHRYLQAMQQPSLEVPSLLDQSQSRTTPLRSLLPPVESLTFAIPDFMSHVDSSRPGRLIYSQALVVQGAEFVLKVRLSQSLLKIQVLNPIDRFIHPLLQLKRGATSLPLWKCGRAQSQAA